MEPKEKYVHEVFQKLADGYDGANTRISAGMHMRWKKAAVADLAAHLGEKPKVLDMCCGTGDMLRLIHAERPGAKLTGIDFSANMLKVAKDRCRDIPDLQLMDGNVRQLPMADNTFDAITISFALRNTADYAGVLKEALRVLKPGGCFLCIDSFVPESRLVRPFYRFYFSCVMPVLGGGIRKRKQYLWLNQSTKLFLSVRQLEKLMEQTGYEGVRHREFMLGACGCVTGMKKENT